MDPGEYDVCTYCNRSIYADASQCPYCGEYTDGNGPYANRNSARMPRTFVIFAWFIFICLLLMMLAWIL